MGNSGCLWEEEMRIVGGGWCFTVFYFVPFFFFLPCAYNFPNWKKKKEKSPILNAMPRDCEAKGHGCCCSATHPATRPDPPTAHVWCPGPVQPMRAVCIYLCAVQIFKVCVCQLLSHVWLFATPQTVVCQASPFMRVFRQEYWSGLPFSSSGGFSQPRDQTPVSCVSFIAGGFFTHWAIREALLKYIFGFIHSSAMTTLQVICTKCFSL